VKLRTRLLLASFLLALTSSGAWADSSTFALPLDVGQGPLFSSGSAPTAYRFQPELAPSLALDRVRLGIPLAASFTDPRFTAGVGPHWRAGAGGRASLRVHSFFGFSDLALWAKVEALVWVPDRQESIAFGIEAEVLSVRVGVSAAKSFESDERYSLLTSIGVELPSLFRILHGSHETHVNGHLVGPTEPTSAELLASGVTSRILGLGSTSALCWVNAHQQEIAAHATIDALIALATAGGQDGVAEAIRESAQAVPGKGDDPARVRAARQGLLTAYATAVEDNGLTCK
jgi:hypothetical protein